MGLDGDLMGLDITAVSRLEDCGKTPKNFDWDTNWGTYFEAMRPGGLKRSTRGLVKGNLYMKTAESETHSFRAGSYGGYNAWRDDLAQFAAGIPAEGYWKGGDEDLPFYELINFSDCEGTIGPLAAKDLLEDFRQHQDAYVLAHAGPTGDYDIQRYDDWLKACELAADNGLIDFH